jgi:hypothetical protein
MQKLKNKYYQVNNSLNPLAKLCNWWFNSLLIARIIALISVINLAVVAFDISYIPLRDIWLNGKVTIGKFKVGPYEYEGIKMTILPKSWRENITKYDVIKGISPYRDTQHYLEEVEALETAINQDGLRSNQSQEVLNILRERTINMINEDPFKLANKSGTLEKIKNLMRQHMDEYINNPQESAKLAFTAFWTVKHLEGRTEAELDFFNQEIKPLINTNYYRPLGESGDFIDYFGLIDFPFIVVIFVDFILRCYAISSRYHGVNFRDAILWRWYDLIFFLPTWRWLRIIPVTIRLDQAKLLDLKSIKKQASQGFVAGIAGDVTEVVVLRIVNQMQNLIKEGQVEKLLIRQGDSREYIDLNEVNEVAEISKVLINLVAYQVLPEIRPEVENLLAYTIEKGIIEAPTYQNVRNLPGFKQFPHNLGQRISTQVYQVLLDSIDQVLQDDPAFAEYLGKIIDKCSQTFNLRLGARQDLNQIEELLVALLEEVKVNYVQKLSEEDIEALLDETRAIREAK